MPGGAALISAEEIVSMTVRRREDRVKEPRGRLGDDDFLIAKG